MRLDFTRQEYCMHDDNIMSELSSERSGDCTSVRSGFVLDCTGLIPPLLIRLTLVLSQGLDNTQQCIYVFLFESEHIISLANVYTTSTYVGLVDFTYSDADLKRQFPAGRRVLWLNILHTFDKSFLRVYSLKVAAQLKFEHLFFI